MQGFSPPKLFSILCKSQDCSFHSLYSLDLDLTPPAKSNTLVCTACRKTLVLPGYSIKAPCSSPRDSLLKWHHFHPCSNQFVCCGCSFSTGWTWVDSVISTKEWQSCGETLLRILITYLRDFLQGNSKKINSQNTAMKQNMNATGESVLKSAGFNLQDFYWYPPEMTEENKETSFQLLREIVLEYSTRNTADFGEYLSKCDFKWQNATVDLCQHLSFTVDRIKWKDNSYWEHVKKLENKLFYEQLGLLSDATDVQVKWAYYCASKDSPTDVPVYLEALVEISQMSKSEDLNEFAGLERSKEIPMQSELNAAYALLGVSPTDTDLELIDSFTRAYSDSNLDEKRQALKTISMGRDSFVLDHFLNTGETIRSIAQGDVTMNSVVDKPIGLNNLGNICYLNSLLQFFFSFSTLRNLIIRYTVRTEELKKPEEFALYLKKLFLDMVISDEASITPEKRIAEMTLFDSKNTFGEQQDVSECMDAMMAMLGTALREKVGPSYLELLFFGKIKQILTYEKNQNLETSQKIEEFGSLIVEISKDIYSSLDSFFAPSSVEMDHVTAQRELFVVDFPKCFLLHINRAKFDQTTKQAFKSNEFTLFYKTIYLDRYVERNKIAVACKREETNRLKEKLSEAELRLASCTKRKDASESPLNMMEMSLNFLLQDTDPSAMTLVTELMDSIEKLKQDISNQLQTIQELETAIQHVYSDMKTVEYRLHAVFMHEGEASFGHYWIYMWDQQRSKWFKYNDSTVEEVSESVVFQDTSGRNSNVYALAYVQKDVEIDLWTRNDSIREQYKHFE